MLKKKTITCGPAVKFNYPAVEFKGGLSGKNLRPEQVKSTLWVQWNSNSDTQCYGAGDAEMMKTYLVFCLTQVYQGSLSK